MSECLLLKTRTFQAVHFRAYLQPHRWETTAGEVAQDVFEICIQDHQIEFLVIECRDIGDGAFLKAELLEVFNYIGFRNVS
jgi:hypothetical protein